MQFRFSVSGFISRHVRLGISGSVKELGCWDLQKCVPLDAFHINEDEHEPSMWSKAISIDIQNLHTIEYKYVSWKDNEKLPTKIDFEKPLDLDYLLVSPVVENIPLPNIKKDTIRWEGGEGNRTIFISKPAPEGFYDMPQSWVHYLNTNENMYKNEYILPVYLYRDMISERYTEEHQVTKSYLRLKNARKMHYNRILDRILLGTCPRDLSHVKYLKEKEDVSDIFTLQAHEDLPDNFPIQNFKGYLDSSSITEAYSQLGVKLTHLSLIDMNSKARAYGTAQAVVLIASLLERDDCTGIYIHCNAGVGRSVSAVCGYLHNILDIPYRLTNFFIVARRPVSYYDEAAMKVSFEQFESKFRGIKPAFKHHRSKNLTVQKTLEKAKKLKQ